MRVKLSQCTPAERAIINVLKQHPTLNNAEIGARLGKAEKTIENQLRRLYKRLGITGENCQRRIALILWIKRR